MKTVKGIVYKMQLRHYGRLLQEALENQNKAFIGSSEWRKWLNVAADYSCEYYTIKKKLDEIGA